MIAYLWNNITRIGMVLGAVVLLSFVSSWTAATPTSSGSHVRMLVREGARYSTMSKQDTNPLVAVMHATYGIAYLEAARKFATDSDISRIAGMKASDLYHHAQKRQQQAIKHISTTCKAVGPEGEVASATGWR